MSRPLSTRKNVKWVRLADIDQATRLTAARRCIKDEPTMHPLEQVHLILVAYDPPRDAGGYVAA